MSSCAILEDEDILEQVSQQRNSASDSDDNTPCAPEPSHADLTPAFAVLSSAYTDPATLSRDSGGLACTLAQMRAEASFIPTGSKAEIK